MRKRDGLFSCGDHTPHFKCLMEITAFTRDWPQVAVPLSSHYAVPVCVCSYVIAQCRTERMKQSRRSHVLSGLLLCFFTPITVSSLFLSLEATWYNPPRQSHVAIEGGSNGVADSILNMKPRKKVWAQILCLGLFELTCEISMTLQQERVNVVMFLCWSLLRSNTPQRIGPVLSCWLWMMKATFPPASTERSWKWAAKVKQICGSVHFRRIERWRNGKYRSKSLQTHIL